MKKIPKAIIAVVFLIFIDLLFLLNNLRNPFLILFGFVFLKGITAYVVNIAMIVIAIAIIFGILKRYKTVYKVATVYYSILVLDAILFLAAFMIIKDEIIAFVNESVAGIETVLQNINPMVFVVSAIISLVLYALILFIILKKKSYFNKKLV